MSVYYHSLIKKVKEDFIQSKEDDFEAFLKKNESHYLKEFETTPVWFSFNMAELAAELHHSIPFYQKIADEFIQTNNDDWENQPMDYLKPKK